MTPKEVTQALSQFVRAGVESEVAKTLESLLGRQKLPDTRTGTTRKIEIADFDLYLTVNFYENDQPGEVFISVAKEGSLVSGLLDIIAVQASLLLQMGVPASTVFGKMVGSQFDPGDHQYKSFVDAIGRNALQMISERGGFCDAGSAGPTVEKG